MSDWLWTLVVAPIPALLLCLALIWVIPDTWVRWRRQLAWLGLCSTPIALLAFGLGQHTQWSPGLASDNIQSQFSSSDLLVLLVAFEGMAETSATRSQLLVPTLIALTIGLGALVAIIMWSLRLTRLLQLRSQADFSHPPAESVPVGFHPALDGPIHFGWRRPVILLPEPARAWSEARLRQVLAHELAHWRQHDWLAQQGVELLTRVCWWQPLCWQLRRSFLRDTEIIADAETVKATGSRAQYASCLLELAQARGKLLAGAVAIVPQPPFVQRMNVLLNNTEVRNMNPVAKLATAVVTLYCAALLGISQVSATPSDMNVHAGGEKDHGFTHERATNEQYQAELQRLKDSGELEAEIEAALVEARQVLQELRDGGLREEIENALQEAEKAMAEAGMEQAYITQQIDKVRTKLVGKEEYMLAQIEEDLADILDFEYLLDRMLGRE